VLLVQFDVFQAYADDLVKQSPVPGLALAFAEHGQVHYEYAHGYRHVENQLPATTSSRFGVGSITKSFTAIALLQLQELGKLAVTDPVTRYLPALRFPGAEHVTLHHLLTHSAGLPMLGTEMYTDTDEGAAPMPPIGAKGRTRIHNVDELMALLAEIDFAPLAPPGAVMSYSNDGWCLLGAVLERASDTPYSEYITRRILEPLELADTTFGTFDAAGNGTARYTATPDGGFQATGGAIWRVAALAAGGGPMLSTCHDLLRYADFFRSSGRGIITANSLRQMTTPHLPVTPTSAYGYGISIDEIAGVGTMLGHGGGDVGVAAFFGTVPETGHSVAVMSNTGTGLAQTLAHGVLRAAAGMAPAAAVPQAVACEAEVRQRFTGTFVADHVKARHRFFIADGELILESGGATHKPIYIGNNTMFVSGAQSFTLATDASGACYGVRSHSRVFVPAAE
jgi:CubicO group peptidase (beta-lactamase class C family)